MDFLAQLWLPILLTAVGVFFASFVAWTVLPHHRRDFARLPDEPRFEAALRGLSIPHGNYLFPWCEHNAQMKDPAFQQRYAAGPNGTLSVWPPASMGRNLALTFLIQLVGSLVVGYLLFKVLPSGQSFASVFHVGTAAGVATWCFAGLPNMVWFGQTVGTMLRHVIDGIAYGLITGVIFAALWPAAA